MARRRRRPRGARALRGAQFGEAAAPLRASECERPRGRRRVGSQARPGSGAPTTARGSGRAAARGPETRDAAAASALPVRLRDDQFRIGLFAGSASVAGARATPSGWVNDFATRRKRLVQTYACSGRLSRWSLFRESLVAAGGPAHYGLRVAAAGTLSPSLLTRASPLAPLYQRCQKARRVCVRCAFGVPALRAACCQQVAAGRSGLSERRPGRSIVTAGTRRRARSVLSRAGRVRIL